MPTHGYTTTRVPPSRVDHVLAHPFELGLSLWAMLGGGSAVFGAFNDQRTVSASLDMLPTLLAAVVGVLLLAGGACIIHGLFDSSDDLMSGFRRERMGLVLFGAGWVAYGLCIAALSVESFLSWSLCAFMAAACALRFWATRRTEQQARKAMQ